MKNRLKIILYFILEFLLSLVILSCISLLILKATVYNPEYIKKQFNDTSFYSKLYTSINNEMSNYIIQSGLDESVLENIYTEEMLKDSINNLIDSIYNNNQFELSIKKVKENLETNINTYLEKNNIQVTDAASLDKFIEKIINVYKEEITLSNSIDFAKKIIIKTDKLINIGFMASIILSIILIICIKLYCKEITLAIPTITIGIIYLFCILFINQNIIIENIFIWDDNVSNLLQTIILNVMNKIKVYGTISLLFGIIDSFLIYIIKQKNK